MKPQLLFSITAEHTYFSNRRCSVLQIVPAPDCVKLLKKYGLLYKLTGEGNMLVCSAGGQPEMAGVDEKTLFNFHIYANDPAFETYTRQSPKWPDEIHYFSNNTQTGRESGSLDRSFVQYPPGQEKADEKLYGLIAIHSNDFSVNRFTITFDAPGCAWKYYLVTGTPPPKYSISGAGMDFEMVAGSPDAVSAALMNAFPDASVTLYASTGEIQFQEMGVKNIQLVNTDTVLVNHLPNPGFGNSGSTIINMRT